MIKCNHINYRLYFDQQKKNNQNFSNLLESDIEFIDSLSQNVFMALKIGKYYLNYEYLKGFKEFPERYLEIEERIVDSLN